MTKVWEHNTKNNSWHLLSTGGVPVTPSPTPMHLLIYSSDQAHYHYLRVIDKGSEAKQGSECVRQEEDSLLTDHMAPLPEHLIIMKLMCI